MAQWRRPWYYAEVDEPLSWIIGVLSVMIAMAGISAFKLSTYLSPAGSSLIVGVVVGMVVHETMHRNVARRYGMRSSYVTNWLGVLITLITSVLPIKLIAPGYTKVYGYYGSRVGILRSLEAGPASNIVMSIVTLIAGLALGLLSSSYIIRFASIWLLGFSYVNSYLAFFNLIPIPPLDGSKILRLNLTEWGVLFGISIVLLVLSIIF